ncbi:hypothetical protein [Nonlabens xylanidelens]|nr:hypothetical protein [Nonlabens xylanidelens]
MFLIMTSCNPQSPDETLIGNWKVTSIIHVDSQEGIINIPRRGNEGLIKTHFHETDVYQFQLKRELTISSEFRTWPQARFYNISKDKELQLFLRNPNSNQDMKPLVKFQIIEIDKDNMTLQSISDGKQENAQVTLIRLKNE